MVASMLWKEARDNGFRDDTSERFTDYLEDLTTLFEAWICSDPVLVPSPAVGSRWPHRLHKPMPLVLIDIYAVWLQHDHHPDSVS